MHRKDYVLIAEVIGKNVPAEDQYTLATKFAEALQTDNPRFDRQLFIAAATRPPVPPKPTNSKKKKA